MCKNKLMFSIEILRFICFAHCVDKRNPASHNLPVRGDKEHRAQVRTLHLTTEELWKLCYCCHAEKVLAEFKPVGSGEVVHLNSVTPPH